jgi:hypothetical protein
MRLLGRASKRPCQIWLRDDAPSRHAPCRRDAAREIVVEFRYPHAIQRPGPRDKVWPGANNIEGIVLHSMQGSLAGGYSVLDDESTDAHGTYVAASWTFSIAKSGTVFQHYALDQSPFHAGSKAQNLRLIGVEHEGGPPGNLVEPLTEPQLAASIALARWVAQQGGFRLSRDAATRTLFEHRELAATLCPSGRIPWDRLLARANLDTAVVGLNVATRYLGFDHERHTFDYELGVLNTFGGEQHLGPNVALDYRGYDQESGEYRYRLHVLKHWSDAR